MQIRQERQALSGQFRRVARHLCGEGVRLSKSMPLANDHALGSLAAGPGQDEELHFYWMNNAVVEGWATPREAANLVREGLAACAAPVDVVVVIWNRYYAGLRLKATDLAAHAEFVLNPMYEATWIVAARPSSWLIQIGLRPQTVSYSPNVPVRTDSLDRGYVSTVG